MNRDGPETDERSNVPVTRPPSPDQPPPVEPPTDAVTTNENDVTPEGYDHVLLMFHPLENVMTQFDPDFATDTPDVDETV